MVLALRDDLLVGSRPRDQRGKRARTPCGEHKRQRERRGYDPRRAPTTPPPPPCSAKNAVASPVGGRSVAFGHIALYGSIPAVRGARAGSLPEPDCISRPTLKRRAHWLRNTVGHWVSSQHKAKASAGTRADADANRYRQSDRAGGMDSIREHGGFHLFSDASRLGLGLYAPASINPSHLWLGSLSQNAFA